MPLKGLTHLNLTMTMPYNSLADYMDYVFFFALYVPIDDLEMLKTSVPVYSFKLPKLESFELISTIKF